MDHNGDQGAAECDQSCIAGVQEMAEQKKEGGSEMLQLLQEVSGAFQPGILTALVGVSGAGKTTLMDVLAGRKTGGLSIAAEWDVKPKLPCDAGP